MQKTAWRVEISTSSSVVRITPVLSAAMALMVTGEQTRTPALRCAAKKSRRELHRVGLRRASAQDRAGAIDAEALSKLRAAQIVAGNAGALARLDLALQRAIAVGIAGEVERLRVAPAAVDRLALRRCGEDRRPPSAIAARRARPCRGRSFRRARRAACRSRTAAARCSRRCCRGAEAGGRRRGASRPSAAADRQAPRRKCRRRR